MSAGQAAAVAGIIVGALVWLGVAVWLVFDVEQPHHRTRAWVGVSMFLVSLYGLIFSIALTS